ncbi:MBL fold metallo-hydrolase [Caldicellulosiruptoraceae bacterium PP1]
MFLEKVIVGELLTNCYIFGTDKEVIVIDPGDEGTKIENIINRFNLKVSAIVLTHGHFDHIMAAHFLKNRFKTKIIANINEKELLNNPRLNLSRHIGDEISIEADIYLNDGEFIDIDDFKLNVIHTPGHTFGSMCLLYDNKILFSGDTIFKDTYGRTDLPTGNDDSIINSIKTKILTLNKDITIYPGHGFSTTIRDEISNYI